MPESLDVREIKQGSAAAAVAALRRWDDTCSCTTAYRGSRRCVYTGGRLNFCFLLFAYTDETSIYNAIVKQYGSVLQPPARAGEKAPRGSVMRESHSSFCPIAPRALKVAARSERFARELRARRVC